MAEDDKTHPTVTWTKKLEEHFAATGERAHCLSWGHKRSEELYSTRRTYIDLPVIVLSSVTGFCSVGQGIIFEGQNKLSSILLGVISLFVGVLNTTGSYFGWAKRTEAHRISSIHYARLYRSIKIEMSLPREERMTPTELLKFCKDQYERLAEISPILPVSVVEDFKHKFQKYVDTVSFPEEMNGLDPIEVFDPIFEAAIRQGGEIARRAEEEYKRQHPHQVLLAASSSENMLAAAAKKAAVANSRRGSRRQSHDVDTSSEGGYTPIPMQTNPLHKLKVVAKSRVPDVVVVETPGAPSMDEMPSAGVGPFTNPLARIGTSVQQFRNIPQTLAAPFQQLAPVVQQAFAPVVQRPMQQVFPAIQQALAPVRQAVAPLQQSLAPVRQAIAPLQEAVSHAVQNTSLQQALAPVLQQAPVSLQVVPQTVQETSISTQQTMIAVEETSSQQATEQYPPSAEQQPATTEPVPSVEQQQTVVEDGNAHLQPEGSDGAV